LRRVQKGVEGARDCHGPAIAGLARPLEIGMTTATVRRRELRRFPAMFGLLLASASCAAGSAYTATIIQPVPFVPPRVYQPSTAITAASTVARLQVLSHHFASSISAGRQTFSIKNANESRVLVLKAAIEAPSAGKLAGTDFVLAYTSPEGKEDRSLCKGIGLAMSRTPGEFDKWVVDDYPEIDLPNAGESIIGLAFVIEAGVTEVTVTRFGSDLAARYVLGLERRPSITVFTDGPGPALEDIRSILAWGGYDVTVRTTLAAAVQTPTIHHTKYAETFARDAAARLGGSFGIVPRVKGSELASVHDVIVWLPGVARMQPRMPVAPVARPVYQPSAEVRLLDPISDLQILSHHFATAINTGSKVSSVEKPTKSRFLVLKVRARRSVGHVKLHCPDFRLSYRRRSGTLDCSQCRAMAISTSSQPGDFGSWRVGDYPAVDIKGPARISDVEFGIAFVLENDVESVALLRAGTSLGALYVPGPDHPFTVYAITNAPTLGLDQVRSAIAAGGFDVITSTELDNSVTEYSIHYQEDAEAAAREVANRLASVLGASPVMKKSRLASSFDIVVWMPRR
jgi:hypothetical protein